MKIVAVTQARYGSSRLPGKVLKAVNGKTLLSIHLKRVLASKKINKLIVATTTEPEAKLIEEIAIENNCSVYKGSLNDVLDRYYRAVKDEKPDYVVRITSDCPLVDAEIIDAVIDNCIQQNADYCSNTLEPTFPDGMDVEVFRFQALETAWKEAVLQSDREHVTPFIWRNSTAKGGDRFRGLIYYSSSDYSDIRVTVDTSNDFNLVNELILAVGDSASWKEYVRYLNENPNLLTINNNTQRNEGLMKSLQHDKIVLREIENYTKSNEYRKKVHDLIPGGAHTYSKGDDQFPELAPAAIDYGKGAYVWDIDGNKFLDCSMGLTSVVLGHAYEPV
ncbi:MAG TPA: hypothetical protein VK173_09625, partial [Lacibacter sp.]|nr:hypothetical protein [Lacibacter sp.]